MAGNSPTLAVSKRLTTIYGIRPRLFRAKGLLNPERTAILRRRGCDMRLCAFAGPLMMGAVRHTLPSGGYGDDLHEATLRGKTEAVLYARTMKHVTYAEKSLLIGDEAADLVLEYASELANAGASDTVTLNALGADGDEVVATLLLGAGAPLMAETSNTRLTPLDNTDAVGYMREKLNQLASPPEAQPAQVPQLGNNDEDYI
jgi:hypothetical protein